MHCQGNLNLEALATPHIQVYLSLSIRRFLRLLTAVSKSMADKKSEYGMLQGSVLWALVDAVHKVVVLKAVDCSDTVQKVDSKFLLRRSNGGVI